MNIFKQQARVRAARSRMLAARRELGEPAGALLIRGRDHPLTTLGVAAGAGLALGSLDVHPLRVPGLASLLGGGLVEAVAHGRRLLAELAELAESAHAAAAPAAPGEDAGAPP